jgi:hypothetical protein
METYASVVGRTAKKSEGTSCQQEFTSVVKEALSRDVLSTVWNGVHLHVVPC